MPCESGPSYEDIRAENERGNIITRLACEYCTKLEAIGNSIPAYAKQWWEEHKIVDAKRIKRELALAKTQELKDKAIAKLTTHERKLLGLEVEKA